MQKNYPYLLLFVGVCLAMSNVTAVEAKDVIVSVAKSKRGACQPKTPEAEVHNLTVKETIKALEDYVHSRKHGPWYDAAFAGPAMRFCGTDERKQVFGHLVKELRTGQPPQRVFDVIANYSGSETLLELIQRELKKKNLGKSFEDNLKRAENLILEQRKTSAPKSDG